MISINSSMDCLFTKVLNLTLLMMSMFLSKKVRWCSKYFFADPSVIVGPPDKPIVLPSEDVCFVLSSQQLEKLRKASSIYQLPDVSVIGANGVIKLVARDKKNDTSNDFSIIVGESDETFTFNFKEENLKIIPDTYNVVVSSKLLSRFSSQNYDLTYYIALNLTPPSVDVILRIIGSTGVIIAYFIVLHVNVVLEIPLHFVADLISIPYFIKTKSWDVVIMLSFLLTISLSKLL